ncbi:antirestriction protein (plasmid) [Klebsiella michiganensis]|uniref:Antirestriction protein n=1 Tax=Klebsiella michiganensis TaxID=1134687 RepID=A0A6P1V6D1_9ENTR|nr:antirestriction protein [Klebsiella michiganensis]QHS50054.1 antirestriction protein [Klebsiella michiganensis]
MLHTQSATTATPVRPSALFDFLPTLFGADYVKAEACIFAYAQKYLRDYCGGEWAFNQLPEGAGYLAPEDERVVVSNPDNWFEGEMSGDAAGIFITAMVLNHRAWMHSHHDQPEASRHYVNRYEQLMAFASTHREASAIYRALD